MRVARVARRVTARCRGSALRSRGAAESHGCRAVGGVQDRAGRAENNHVARHRRTDTAQQIAELLETAKDSLHLSVAFLSRLDGTTQHLEVVEASGPAALLFREGATQVQATSFCQAILDGDLPPVIPDVTRHPARHDAARSADAADPQLRVGAGHALGRHALRHLLRGGPHDRQGPDQARPGADGGARARGLGDPRARAARAGRPRRDRGTAAAAHALGRARGGAAADRSALGRAPASAPRRCRASRPSGASRRTCASPRRTASASATGSSCSPSSARPSTSTRSAATSR